MPIGRGAEVKGQRRIGPRRIERTGTVLHLSRYLSGQRLHDYPQLLREAIVAGSDAMLIAALKQQRLQRIHQQAKRREGYSTTAAPDNAAQVLAESEFNGYYICVLARRAI